MCKSSLGLGKQAGPRAGVADGSKGGWPPYEPDANVCDGRNAETVGKWVMQYRAGIGCPAIAWYALTAYFAATSFYIHSVGV